MKIIPVIVSNSEILGGAECIAETRIPISIIMYHLDRDGLGAVLKTWPYLKKHKRFLRTVLSAINNIISDHTIPAKGIRP